MASQQKEHDATFKILILGDSNVGKTCLIHRYCERAFYESYISTIGIDCKQKLVTIEGQKVRLRICTLTAGKKRNKAITFSRGKPGAKVVFMRDTAGQERFRTLTTAYYRGAQGIILVYDITNVDSFNHLSYWLRNIEEMASSDIMKILVGNKSDKAAQRTVDESRAKKMAENFGIHFLETSCKTGENVDEAFDTLAQEIKEVVDQKYGGQKLNAEGPSWIVDDTKKQSWCAC